MTDGFAGPPATAFGLDLDCAEDVGVPVEAFVILKSYVDGEPQYKLAGTPNLTVVESIGMLEWAKHVFLNTSMILSVLEDGDDDE